MLWAVNDRSEQEGLDMANQLGKRYVCAQCPAQLLVSKSGDGSLVCHGEPMTVETPKPLPSSD
jgi:hypothetical protein